MLKKLFVLISSLVLLLTPQLDICAKAYTWQSDGNPIIKHMRAADPCAHVWEDGKLWVYASHDQDNATDYSSMDGYHVYSTSDLKNWTDHGEILHSTSDYPYDTVDKGLVSLSGFDEIGINSGILEVGDLIKQYDSNGDIEELQVLNIVAIEGEYLGYSFTDINFPF